MHCFLNFALFLCYYLENFWYSEIQKHLGNVSLILRLCKTYFSLSSFAYIITKSQFYMQYFTFWFGPIHLKQSQKQNNYSLTLNIRFLAQSLWSFPFLLFFKDAIKCLCVHSYLIFLSLLKCPIILKMNCQLKLSLFSPKSTWQPQRQIYETPDKLGWHRI